MSSGSLLHFHPFKNIINQRKTPLSNPTNILSNQSSVLVNIVGYHIIQAQIIKQAPSAEDIAIQTFPKQTILEIIHNLIIYRISIYANMVRISIQDIKIQY